MSRIIVAEDDEILGALLQEALLSAGHAVGVLKNGADAFETMCSREPDLVIIDLGLPDMGGVMLIEQLRKRPQLARMPILVLTARKGGADQDIAIYAGANRYLRKSVPLDFVVFTIEEMLEETHQEVRPGAQRQANATAFRRAGQRLQAIRRASSSYH